MDRNGFLPEHGCNLCQVQLSDTERYLGIYTGLCNRCMNSPAYIVSVYKMDNALTISHPPSSPSYSRDRSHQTSYIDCPACDGTGHIHVFRSYARGGSYYGYCQDCFNRFYDHSHRVAFAKEIGMARKKMILMKEMLDAEFSKALPIVLREKSWSESSQDEREQFNELAHPFLDRYNNYKLKIISPIEEKYAQAYERKEYRSGEVPLR